jgi:PTH1 family peptidyl-tRNA hydrolase
LYLVVGLGNPGERYAATRHNVGARVVELAAKRWSVSLTGSPEARLGSGRVGPTEVLLAQPLAWMNQSGPAVRKLLEQAGLPPSQLIVVHDDLDLELGRLRIRPRGGTGGHNGLLSVITTLATEEFSRVKIGIGRPAAGEDPADFVLSPFSSDDRVRIDPCLNRAVEAVEYLLTEGLEAAMNRYNARGSETTSPDDD